MDGVILVGMMGYVAFFGLCLLGILYLIFGDEGGDGGE